MTLNGKGLNLKRNDFFRFFSVWFKKAKKCKKKLWEFELGADFDSKNLKKTLKRFVCQLNRYKVSHSAL